MLMKPKRHTFLRGTIVVAIIAAAGVPLQFLAGPVRWAALTWPTNAVVLAAFAVVLAALHALRSRNAAVRFLSTVECAVPATIAATVATVAMGLIRQEHGEAPAGSIFPLEHMLQFWPFVLCYALIAVILGLTMLRQLANFRLRRLPSLLCHAGLLLFITAGTLGSADVKRARLTLKQGQSEWRALTDERHVVHLPFEVRLDSFVLTEYAAQDVATPTASATSADSLEPAAQPRQPKNFESFLTIKPNDADTLRAVVSVNHPASLSGWNIYQLSYHPRAAGQHYISVLEVICDPWQGLAGAGVALLLCGAVGMLFVKRANAQ